MRAGTIKIRMLPEQMALIDRAANSLGKNRSDFMLEVICEYTRTVLLDQIYFALDGEKFHQFNDMLNAFEGLNPRLDTAFSILPLVDCWCTGSFRLTYLRDEATCLESAQSCELT